MKKPMLQVLIRGFHQSCDDNSCRVLLVPPDSVGQIPSMCTGHKALQEMCLEFLADGCPLPEKIEFWVCKYHLNPFAPMLSANDVRRYTFAEFLVRPQKRQTTRKAKLPFGLTKKKQSRKRRKKQPNKENAPKRTAYGGGTSRQKTIEEVTHELGAAVNAPTATDTDQKANMLQHDACSDPDPDSDSTVSDSSGGSESEIEIDENKATGGDLKVAEEAVRSAEAKKEESETSRLEAERQKRIESASHSNENPQQKKKTFCNHQIGLVSASMQVAARLAGCRHCLMKVPKGAVRFGYSYSLTKFASYLHKDCVLPHLEQEEADLGQAKEFLTTFLNSREGTSCPAEVRQAAEALQRKLQAKMGEASSSTVQ